MIKLKPLADQVILITGASSGIGRVTARRAAAEGASVFLVARNEASLREVADIIAADGGTAAYAVADVGDAAAVERAAAAAIDRFGRIDTWVSNAGTAIYGKLVDTPLAEHEQLFRTNYWGAVHSSLTAHAYMKEHGGALVVVGSIASDLPSPILSAYSASKHAVKGFVDAFRMELIGDGVPISVTLVKPSGIDTPIAQRAANHLEGEGLIPPPVYDPELVAKAILHAATHVRRDLTVGGAGRLQVLIGEHFPALLDMIAGPLARRSADRSRPRTEQDSLFRPEQAGRERSGVQPGRKTSLYTAAERHPLVTKLAFLGAAAGVAGLVVSSRKRADRA